ncbi:unnamed protein product [Dovyalis caffra]|uniref:Uncharacterized protein n=1 Tax=Dovyalis caffra TaxID=77055 RepID=A0AAV1S8J3_9ROSI|nr:unnamed protein product [Dovyalis caffra]
MTGNVMLLAADTKIWGTASCSLYNALGVRILYLEATIHKQPFEAKRVVRALGADLKRSAQVDCR